MINVFHSLKLNNIIKTVIFGWVIIKIRTIVQQSVQNMVSLTRLIYSTFVHLLQFSIW